MGLFKKLSGAAKALASIIPGVAQLSEWQRKGRELKLRQEEAERRLRSLSEREKVGAAKARTRRKSAEQEQAQRELDRIAEERRKVEERLAKLAREARRPKDPLGRALAGEWVSVTSSNLDRISYDGAWHGGMLKVIFKDQNEYHVWPVSVKEFTDLFNATSLGGWYWDHVRIRGTALGHQKSYVHIASHGSVTRRWTESPEKVLEHLDQMEDESQAFNLYQNKGPMVRGVIPPHLIGLFSGPKK